MGDKLKKGNYDHLFFPINNATSSGSGSHWSMLRYSKKDNTYRYYDSYGRCNLDAAKKTAKKIDVLLDKKPSFEIVEDVPQQLNGYDCGMYTIFFIEIFMKSIHEDKELQLHEFINASIINEKRKLIKNDINKRSFEQKNKGSEPIIPSRRKKKQDK